MRPHTVERTGFTLLELLLVMTIIAILAGTVVVGFGNVGASQRLRGEAERLALAIEMSRGEALSRNGMWGMQVQEHSYGFSEYDYATGRWQNVTRRQFSNHVADQGITFALALRSGGQAFGDLANLPGPEEEDEKRRGWRAEGDDASEDEEEEAVPVDIAILPGGEITPFDIIVASEDAAPWAVRSDGIQAVRALPASDVPAMDAELARLARRL